ncbi:hypothetical protein FRACYDRAFT_234554 [Fragilariopsis cylindrus CCMP1102]|uniref:Uncharacterized protein n=1 Tax=Fragilariopsis cylindrus CCMP1102 TaxID=635003 RepID=A0A1E7FSW9_9STRA|nr:hypothetical protein FRACYDRAFT_234554 [Fragilariopsis cylindrus CCMP1102]|eukprot:OEU20923.1 hypothetical protein FRACYDRAFT_234554 [Fragilariopsis cylindrus CCMP1102]
MTTKRISVKTKVSVLATGFAVCLAVDHIIHPKPLGLEYVVDVLPATVGLTLVALMYVFESDHIGIHYYMDHDYNITSDKPDPPQPQPLAAAIAFVDYAPTTAKLSVLLLFLGRTCLSYVAGLTKHPLPTYVIIFDVWFYPTMTILVISCQAYFSTKTSRQKLKQDMQNRFDLEMKLRRESAIFQQQQQQQHHDEQPNGHHETALSK